MKILFITTVSNTINAFLIPHIKMLIEQGHRVDIACKIVREIDTKAKDLGCDIYDIPFSRSPLRKDNLRAYKRLKAILETGEYDIVHSHTPIASMIARIACKNINTELKGAKKDGKKVAKVKLIYTAHGFHFYKGAPMVNWLIYYPIEKWLSKYTDVLITINNEDNERALKAFKAERIELIPGVGIETKKFVNTVVDRDKKKEEFGIPENSNVVLSVGELNRNKNHQLVIEAIARLKDRNISYLVCGDGPLKEELIKLAQELGINERVFFPGHRNDLNEIYKIADIFVFPSKREGLPVSLMEAMASGLPIICSKIRGNVDLVEDNKNGLLAKENDADEYMGLIEKLLDNPDIGRRLAGEGQRRSFEYDIEKILEELRRIY